ncbi:hypothetical protein [Acidovorax phage AP1]|nr:hypothetical protein [Acidovorax phage AP1]
MCITAIVLSAKPVTLELPGVVVLGQVGQIRDAAELYAARLAAVRRVRTRWWFCLDDDDELPEGWQDLLARCMASDAAVAYTNELLCMRDGREVIRRAGSFSRDAYRERVTLIHHLAVCRTDAALRAMERIPTSGCWGFEPMLFAEVASAEGGEWIDEVGYIWHEREGGLSRHPSVPMAMLRAGQWINGRRTWH